jgi:hypothetical protein
VELWEMVGDEEVAEVEVVEADDRVAELEVVEDAAELEEEDVILVVVELLSVVAVVEVEVLVVDDDVLVVEEDETVELDVVVVVVVAGTGNMTNLLLPVSVTQRFPELSATTPQGALRPLWPTPRVLDPRLCCPSATTALMPLESGPANSKTRELPRSATHRLPKGSTATPVGFLSVLLVVPPEVPAKSS